MELEPIGAVADPSTLDLEPLVVPIVGYREDRTPVTTKIRFRPVPRAGGLMRMLLAADTVGNISEGTLLKYLEDSILEADREKWHALCDSDEVFVRIETLVEVYGAVTAHYAKRPTRPRSGSRAGSRRTPRTGADAGA